MPGLPSARFVIDQRLSDQIVRHVRRNEKSLLLKKLAGIGIGRDQPLVQDAWFAAACHKHGVDVSRILVKANVRCASDGSLLKAIERGLWPVVRAQLPAIDFLSPLPQYARSRHVLVLAATAGHANVLRDLLAHPMLSAGDARPAPLSLSDKATRILGILCASNRDHLGHQVVPCLVNAGADLSKIIEDASAWHRTTLLAAAMSRGHFELARALRDAGADPHQQVKASTGPRAMFDAWLHSVLPAYNRNAQLPPKAWAGLELLQAMGLELPELEDMDTYFRFKANTQLYLSRPDGERILAMALHRKMERDTPCAPARPRGGPRL